VYEWILPSLREILIDSQSDVAATRSVSSEQKWRISLAATESLLLKTLVATPLEQTQGLVITAPAPLFSQPQIKRSLQTVTFTAKPFNALALMPFEIPSKEIHSENLDIDQTVVTPQELILSILPNDPLGQERFCLVFTHKFRLVLVLAEDKYGKKEFLFSFASDVVQQAWRALGARIVLTDSELFGNLDLLVADYHPIAPDYKIIVSFSHLLLQELAEPETDKVISTASIPTSSTQSVTPVSPTTKTSARSDVELLQAFAHEVRTPLTTIRTMTRLLLKRQDLPANVMTRIQAIDHECTAQIDRMELLFKAAELETANISNSANTQLTPMSLDQVLQQSIPRWQLAANRRNLTLDVVLPQQLPTVVSNPVMLDRVLTGLMENFTRSLPPNSHIQVRVIPAGDQLKLQLSPQCDRYDETKTVSLPIRKALGELLMFQPDTGTISLNLAATKHLFQAIGGKLIVRQRPQYGEILTIFLPLSASNQPKTELR